MLESNTMSRLLTGFPAAQENAGGFFRQNWLPCLFCLIASARRSALPSSTAQTHSSEANARQTQRELLTKSAEQALDCGASVHPAVSQCILRCHAAEAKHSGERLHVLNTRSSMLAQHKGHLTPVLVVIYLFK